MDASSSITRILAGILAEELPFAADAVAFNGCAASVMGSGMDGIP
jgi:hypothetical protein